MYDILLVFDSVKILMHLDARLNSMNPCTQFGAAYENVKNCVFRLGEEREHWRVDWTESVPQMLLFSALFILPKDCPNQMQPITHEKLI